MSVNNPEQYITTGSVKSTSHEAALPELPSLSGLNMRELWLVLQRSSRILGGISILTILGILIFLLISTPLYTAEAVLQINVQKSNIVNIESVMSGITSDESQIQSQLDIISSRNLAGRVVDALNLVNDSEFSPNVNKGGIIKWAVSKIKGEDYADSENDKKEKQEIRSKTVTNVLDRLKVVRNPKSYTIVLKYTSKSPGKAALIANAFVSEYLKGQLTAKFDATERANSWLTEKLIDLQGKVRQSEMLVQAFREKHGLIETSGRTITDQQLSELNTQLILARTEKAQAEARLNATGEDESSADVLRSPLIQNLRNQETEVLRKKSDLSNQYGPKHPKMINVSAELSDLRAKIDIEIKKVRESIQNEVSVATAREDSLKRSLDELQDKTGLSTKAKIELGELERLWKANKSLYESFLERSKETSEGHGLENADAFVISNAEEPVSPSYPVPGIVILVAFIIGISIATLVILMMEHLDNAVTSSKQAEEVTGISSIGMIPELEKKSNIMNYLIKKPSSVFAESLRSVLTAVHFSNPDKTPKVIMVTSSVPKEGKSSFVLTFASLAANSGKKVLLIDCDLKRPTIAKALKREFEFGLSDLLADRATESQVICHEEKTGLDFIPAHPNTVNSHNLLGSNKMKELLGRMHDKYDMIVIDSPPIMAISDSIVLAKIVDTTIFVVRWQKTSREIVKTAIKQLKSFNINMAGVVLTRVDIKKQSKYGYGDKGYYYTNYSEYYSG